MSKQYRIILVISFLLTAFFFRYEWVHDVPSPPYTLRQTISEIAIGGSILVGLSFAILSGLYFVITKLVGKK